jgi:SAM-dependent methyltransferase
VTETVRWGTALKRARGAVLRRLHTPGPREGYFEALAPSYDDWWTRTGRMANTEHLSPGWEAEVAALRAKIEAFEPARTLDVGCGTGFLTRWLPGLVVGLDTGEAMLEIARRQAPEATFVRGDALSLPFPDRSFRRVFASHIYGHLDRAERGRFRQEARRVADEIVILDTAGADRREGSIQMRGLADGSRWRVFKQPFTPERLIEELGPGELLHRGTHFVMVRFGRRVSA